MTFIKKILQKTPFIGPILINRIWSFKKKFRKINSAEEYWENLYKGGGNSGEGSYKELAIFKANILNEFINESKINSCIEFGCGDGNQLSLIYYPNYIGLDVSSTIIRSCIEKFHKDSSKSFFIYDSLSFKDNHSIFNAELSISLDVIYHLIDDNVYNKYMTDLFNSSSKYVIIYASNYDSKVDHHEKNHKFTDWVEGNLKNWKLNNVKENIYKYDKYNPDSSRADFYFFIKTD